MTFFNFMGTSYLQYLRNSRPECIFTFATWDFLHYFLGTASCRTDDFSRPSIRTSLGLLCMDFMLPWLQFSYQYWSPLRMLGVVPWTQKLRYFHFPDHIVPHIPLYCMHHYLLQSWPSQFYVLGIGLTHYLALEWCYYNKGKFQNDFSRSRGGIYSQSELSTHLKLTNLALL